MFRLQIIFMSQEAIKRFFFGGVYCEVIHNPATDSSITSSIKASVQ